MAYIKVENLKYRYPNTTKLALDGLDFEIEKGSFVGIIGENGAGKSTLVNLACRFFEPTQGRILIDGRDARERSQLWRSTVLFRDFSKELMEEKF